MSHGQDIEVTVAPARRLVAAGKNIGFECGYKLPHGHSDETKQIFWQKEGVDVRKDRSETTSDGILILKNVQESDSGVYTCAVRSSHFQEAAVGAAHAVLTVVSDEQRFKSEWSKSILGGEEVENEERWEGVTYRTKLQTVHFTNFFTEPCSASAALKCVKGDL